MITIKNVMKDNLRSFEIIEMVRDRKWNLVQSIYNIVDRHNIISIEDIEKVLKKIKNVDLLTVCENLYEEKNITDEDLKSSITSAFSSMITINKINSKCNTKEWKIIKKQAESLFLNQREIDTEIINILFPKGTIELDIKDEILKRVGTLKGILGHAIRLIPNIILFPKETVEEYIENYWDHVDENDDFFYDTVVPESKKLFKQFYTKLINGFNNNERWAILLIVLNMIDKNNEKFIKDNKEFFIKNPSYLINRIDLFTHKIELDYYHQKFGKVQINLKPDEWYLKENNPSAKTLENLDLSKLNMPYKFFRIDASEYIENIETKYNTNDLTTLNKFNYIYLYEVDNFIYLALSGKIINKMDMNIIVNIDRNKTLADNIVELKERLQDSENIDYNYDELYENFSNCISLIEDCIYLALQVILFTNNFKEEKEYVTDRTKLIKPKSNITELTDYVYKGIININQFTRAERKEREEEEKAIKSGKKITKTFWVIGHWRNLKYKNVNFNEELEESDLNPKFVIRPKWIKPFPKGKDRKIANRIANISKD